MEPERKKFKTDVPPKKLDKETHKIWELVPKDVWAIIFQNLDVRDILRLFLWIHPRSFGSKKIKQATRMESLWKYLFIRDFPDVFNDLYYPLPENLDKIGPPDFVRALTTKEKEKEGYPEDSGQMLWKRAYFWCRLFVRAAEKRLVYLANQRYQDGLGFDTSGGLIIRKSYKSKDLGSIEEYQDTIPLSQKTIPSIEFANNYFSLTLDENEEFAGGLVTGRGKQSRMTIAFQLDFDPTSVKPFILGTRDLFLHYSRELPKGPWEDWGSTYLKNVSVMFYRYWLDKMYTKDKDLLEKDDKEIKSSITSYQVPEATGFDEAARERIGKTFFELYGFFDPQMSPWTTGREIIYVSKVKNSVRRRALMNPFRENEYGEKEMLQKLTLGFPVLYREREEDYEDYTSDDSSDGYYFDPGKSESALYLGCNYCNSNSLEGRESYNSTSNSSSSSLMRCKGCKTTLYCGKKCQLKDWDNHKLECK